MVDGSDHELDFITRATRTQHKRNNILVIADLVNEVEDTSEHAKVRHNEGGNDDLHMIIL